jgi:hypothetical protein
MRAGRIIVCVKGREEGRGEGGGPHITMQLTLHVQVLYE